MERKMSTIALILLVAGSLVWAAGPFAPAKVGEWVITYNPGSGADVFTRNVVTSLQKGNISAANMPVVSKAEGSGMVGIQYVAQIGNQEQANNTLLTIGGGDFSQAVKLARLDPKSIQPIALMVAEIPLLSKGKGCRFKDFNEAIATMKAGKQVIIGGPQNDYEEMARQIAKLIGVTEKELTYIPYGSGKEGITAMMGNHVDFALSTPSHAAELIASGDVIPQWVYSTTHYQFGSLVKLPTFSEYTGGKYKNLEYAVYRVVCASAKMSPEAVSYWVDCLRKATKTPEWEVYCAKYSLVTVFKPLEEARSFM